ncbi:MULTISPECIES: isopentenyl-diphosphate Delta-isomerase [Citrobacter]|uniref:Isopentenyl-diphosphate Delta-isomerase n=1 Tax=Citrobacter werkmanii TaxID=67827 RepID=A0A9N8GTR2_9ENTR|nr:MULTISPECIES: isopentenyl-diphosphate Delta-isomerase [Citrobacter]BBV29350.1 isopentenyl-diphosphate Delta-isomerase [Citrobacter freundii]MBJ8414043.1 isopentenyl-diphosphate Delta-isomerase [Citrobacter cronae]MBQ4924708.1 isopentenyl-diphosphate Delta-isomerase [Citrobacter werkmanii]MBQ4936392.1 isopentenyl-diphosphate Delta-isomerase [Citrobacter werkmanii]MBQ4948374.1 isopentenyl-diphosphate Delta-isomerase [Citrobacter werkmanii]
MAGEHVILLDEQNKPSGMLEKYAAHTFNTPLHLAFSCWIFNDQGQLLVTRRSLHKKAWPGVWTNSVCGHPQSGETTEDAVIRRARFELSADITALASVYADFRYCATDPNGIMENEVCPVYAAQLISQLQPNADEVMDYQWSNLEDVLSGIDATPWAFSPWMVMQASNDKARELLRKFANGN